jgi:hypothetical protein
VRASEYQGHAGNSTHHFANHVFSPVKGGGGLLAAIQCVNQHRSGTPPETETSL